MCVCVCMYVSMHVCMYVCEWYVIYHLIPYLFFLIEMALLPHTHTHTHTHIHIYIYIYVSEYISEDTTSLINIALMMGWYKQWNFLCWQDIQVQIKSASKYFVFSSRPPLSLYLSICDGRKYMYSDYNIRDFGNVQTVFLLSKKILY